MATTGAGVLQVRGLGRGKLDELAKKAKRLGVTPEKYVKNLVEEDLAAAREARTTTFGQLMGLGRAVDEEEVDRMVERARTRHNEKTSKKRR